ncbi:MAG: helix-turn-helix transcriptional regulator [Bradyrhizobiaceae bacterium]|nr:helix-turn-helix transcriptional regulator [Bradyrhizobiaceae bacterium]
MFANAGCQHASADGLIDQDRSQQPKNAILLSLDRRPHVGLERGRVPHSRHQQVHFAVARDDHAVKISPPEIVKRRILTWDGMAAETVQATARKTISFRFRSPLHLLVAWEHAVRSDGESFVEGLPRSRLRDVRRKLIFVPADHEYAEWGEPRVRIRVMYFYFDPDWMPTLPETTNLPSLVPRLFFEDPTLWNTALKLNKLIENSGSESSLYIHALGTVLAHELVRLNAGTPLDACLRGGLAAWQQRTVADYIEEHVADQISLATLAQLVRLSPYYFCRAFKQSFGMPPHRYHNSRRIEHAKMLLAKPASSVTDIGLTLGFSETSSFTAAFHRATGLTPTSYRRSLTSLNQG